MLTAAGTCSLCRPRLRSDARKWSTCTTPNPPSALPRCSTARASSPRSAAMPPSPSPPGSAASASTSATMDGRPPA
eukprot:130037-Chlamydomonas_euryale.AAC.4